MFLFPGNQGRYLDRNIMGRAVQATLLAAASITGASAFFSSPGAGAISSVRSSASVASTSALGTKR